VELQGIKPASSQLQLTITPPGDTQVNTFRCAFGQWDKEGESVTGNLRYVRRCKETNDALAPVTSYRQQTTDGLRVWPAEVAVPRVGVEYGLLTSAAGQPSHAPRTVHSAIHNTQSHTCCHTLLSETSSTPCLMDSSRLCACCRQSVNQSRWSIGRLIHRSMNQSMNQ